MLLLEKLPSRSPISLKPQPHAQREEPPPRARQPQSGVPTLCHHSAFLTLQTVSLAFHLPSSFFKASGVPHIPAGGQEEGQALDTRSHQLAGQAPSSLVTKQGGTGLSEAQGPADHHH